MLGVLGGALGLAVALAAVRLAAPYLPPDMARAADLSLDWRVLLFTAAVSLGTSVLFGLAPLRRRTAHGRRTPCCMARDWSATRMAASEAPWPSDSWPSR